MGPATAWETAADPGLRDVLRYLQTGEALGPLSEEIDALVDTFNKDREWVNRVLTYEQETEMRCRRAREEALEQGIEQGMDRLGTLIGRLIDAGRLDDAKRVSEDAAYRDKLLSEFRLQGWGEILRNRNNLAISQIWDLEGGERGIPLIFGQ